MIDMVALSFSSAPHRTPLGAPRQSSAAHHFNEKMIRFDCACLSIS
jgi:hypothetical protein